MSDASLTASAAAYISEPPKHTTNLAQQEKERVLREDVAEL